MRALRFILAMTALVSSAQAATLDLMTLDESGKAVPCRVLVRGSDGQCVVPAGSVTFQTGEDRWFMSPGQCQVELPSGETKLRIERGLEYVRVKETLTVDSDRLSKTYRLRRWINMRERGYLCGENHLHVDSVRLAPMLAAEDLDFGTSLTWWRGPDRRRPVPPGQGRVRILEFAGIKTPTSIFDAELEYSWGAAYIQNLPAPMPLEAESGRPNLDYLRHAVDAGAIVHYQGGWSREVLVDALLGFVHTVNVCNNNFALQRFQPRSRYSNLLEVRDFPVYPNTDRGMMYMNTDTYYRLLNCGLQLAAGAGSATGVKHAPVGYNRAYVRADAGATLNDFYQSWKAGKNFVTNGPMVFLRTVAGERPGDVVDLPEGGGDVQLQVDVVSDQPLLMVEIVVNGEIVASYDAKAAKTLSRPIKLEVSRGSWIAARCTARDGLLGPEEMENYEERRDDGSIQVTSSRLRFAHTSPLYVRVADQGAAVEQSIREGQRMLDRFEDFARANADAQYQSSIIDAIQQARRRLREKAALASEVRS